MLRVGIVAILFYAVQAWAFFISSDTISLGTPPDVGHEEITRQALLLVGDLLKKSGNNVLFQDSQMTGDLNPAFAGTIAADEIDVITRGNYATDLPRGSYLISLNDYWGFPSTADWNYPMGQHLHFLRDYLDQQTLTSAYDTCMIAREKILRASIDAIKLWQSGERNQFLFLIGHATHMIQDSFSPAHTIRQSREDNNNVVDICYYPDSGAPPAVPETQICFHKSVDNRDFIWLAAHEPDEIAKTKSEWLSRGEEVEPLEDVKKFDPNDATEAERHAHLKHEARLARTATAKYLYLIFEDLEAREKGLLNDPDFKVLNQKLTTQLFEGNNGEAGLADIMPQGIMRCETLNKKSVHLTRKLALNEGEK